MGRGSITVAWQEQTVALPPMRGQQLRTGTARFVVSLDAVSSPSQWLSPRHPDPVGPSTGQGLKHIQR